MGLSRLNVAKFQNLGENGHKSHTVSESGFLSVDKVWTEDKLATHYQRFPGLYELHDFTSVKWDSIGLAVKVTKL